MAGYCHPLLPCASQTSSVLLHKTCLASVASVPWWHRAMSLASVSQRKGRPNLASLCPKMPLE